MATTENKALAHRYLEAFAKGDLAVLDECIASEYVKHDPGLPFEVRGPEGAKQLSAALRTAFPDFSAEFEDVVAEADRVLVRMTLRGTQRGELMGIPPTGQAVAWGVMDLFRIRDGQIVEQWTIADTLGLLQQLGVIPAPAPAEA